MNSLEKERKGPLGRYNRQVEEHFFSSRTFFNSVSFTLGHVNELNILNQLKELINRVLVLECLRHSTHVDELT